MKKPVAIVIGAGIVGLALARALALRGYQVQVFERYERAVGASVRNFGMIWPIGVANGPLYRRALASRRIWQEFCDEAGVWYDASGSLHLAYADDELATLAEYAAANASERPCQLLDAAQTRARSAAVVERGLKGSLWSSDEMVLDPRSALAQLPAWLERRYGVQFFWRHPVTAIEFPQVRCGKRSFTADAVYVASGAEFETLYPDLFAALPITRCKLQMMRLAPQPDGLRLGAALCGGLSLIHYPGFQVAPSVAALRERYRSEHAALLDLGIHVMAAQNGAGEITIGDSHEYGHTHDPFDRADINAQVLDYLRGFLQLPSWQLGQSWHGIYAKLTDGRSELVLEAEPGVTVVNGVGGGGLGMTLSFGLAEEIVAAACGTPVARVA